MVDKQIELAEETLRRLKKVKKAMDVPVTALYEPETCDSCKRQMETQGYAICGCVRRNTWTATPVRG